MGISWHGTDYLVYALVDSIVDSYFNVLEVEESKMEAIDDELLSNPSKNTVERLHAIKKEMLYLKKTIWPVREMIGSIERNGSNLIESDIKIYIRDVYDHSMRIIETLEALRDMVSGMMELYLSNASMKLNEVMKVLTIISTIFIPITFITSVYGMNFEGIEEIHFKHGYAGVWTVMITISLSLLYYFRKKKWL